jgi:branched-chain amino acid transport system permease protein
LEKGVMIERLRNYQNFGPALLLAVGAVAPLAAPNDYVVGVLARICLYSLLALGLNVVVGFAGLLDIGYVAFFGIGSYIYAFLASPHFGLHVPFLLVMPIVTLVAAISGVLIGAPTLRLRGDYLAIVTLGFGEITYICLVNLDRPINITGGPSGLISIDPPSFFGYVIERNIQYYYLFLVTLGGMLLACVRLRDSRIGWAWQAIREDELAAEATGVNTTVAKLQAFAIGASFAGFAGGLLASWQRSVFPDNFLFQESINILAMVILGGMGNVVGVVLGAAVIVALPEIFRDLALYRLLAFGAILMVLMIFRPQGLFPARPAMAAEEAQEDAAGRKVESAAKP